MNDNMWLSLLSFHLRLLKKRDLKSAQLSLKQAKMPDDDRQIAG